MTDLNRDYLKELKARQDERLSRANAQTLTTIEKLSERLGQLRILRPGLRKGIDEALEVLLTIHTAVRS